MRTIIIEDEQEGMLNLELKLERYCPEVEIIAKCETGESAVKAIKALVPNLVFLDIHLGSMSGFDVLDKVQQIPFELIFITSHEQYARQAVRTGAVDFILKPFRPLELQEAVTAAAERIRTSANISRIIVPDGSAARIIKTKDILYCLADNVWTDIYSPTDTKNVITVAKTIGSIYAMLPNDQFFRISRQAVINLEYVDKVYNHAKNSYLTLQNRSKNQFELGVSKSRIDSLLNKLSRG